MVPNIELTYILLPGIVYNISMVQPPKKGYLHENRRGFERGGHGPEGYRIYCSLRYSGLCGDSVDDMGLHRERKRRWKLLIIEINCQQLRLS